MTKRLRLPTLLALCLLLVLVALPTPVWAGGYIVQSAQNVSCSTASFTCNITMGSAVGTGHLLVVGMGISTTGTSITAVSDNGTSSNTYTHCTNCNGQDATVGSVDGAYVLSTNSGAGTVITVTISPVSNSSWQATAVEISYTGTSLTFDTSNNADDTTAATTNAGVGLTLAAGGTDMVVQLARFASADSASSVNNGYIVAKGSTGSGIAYLLNADPSNSGAAPTWTINTSTRMAVAAMAFTENCGASVICERPILNGSSSSAATSYATATFTPIANRPTLLTVRSTLASSNGPNAPTASGDGLTCAQVGDLKFGATQGTGKANRLTTLSCIGASPTAGALTIDYAGQTQGTSTTWLIDDFRNTVTTGTGGSGAVVQTHGDAIPTANTGSTTLSAFASASNPTYGVGGLTGTGGVYTAGTGFFVMQQNNAIRSLVSEFDASNQTTVALSWGSTATTSGVVGFELNLAVASTKVRHRAAQD